MMKHLIPFESIRSEYQKHGVKDYYTKHSNDYKNPHSDKIEKCLDWCLSKIDIGYFLDLGCGDGVVSQYLRGKNILKFDGCDPHFKNIYQSKLNHTCYDLSFEDISKFGLEKKYDTIICSYSLHLCPKSYFNQLLYQLSISCDNLVIISPSKYPIINDYFNIVETNIIDRCHVRIFST